MMYEDQWLTACERADDEFIASGDEDEYRDRQRRLGFYGMEIERHVIACIVEAGRYHSQDERDAAWRYRLNRIATEA